MTASTAKTNSHEILRRYGIQINDSLPEIEPREEMHPQDARSVAIRCVVLSHVIGVGFGGDTVRLKGLLEEFDLYRCASPREQDLLSKHEHTEQERLDATWLTECVQSLAWCLGLVKLDPFRRCDDDLASHFPRPAADPRYFISKAALLPFDEIYQQADLHYRLHWAARNARLMGQRCRVGEEFIGERRKALDWVVGVATNWDEIPDNT
jgi:hypothetical protein